MYVLNVTLNVTLCITVCVTDSFLDVGFDVGFDVCFDVCFDVMCCLNDMDCNVVCLGTMFSSYFIFFFRLSMEEKNNIGGTLCSSANLVTIYIIEATQVIFMLCLFDQ